MDKGDYRKSYGWYVTESNIREITVGEYTLGCYGRNEPFSIDYFKKVYKTEGIRYRVYNGNELLFGGWYLGNPQCSNGFGPLDYSIMDMKIDATSIYYEVDGVFRRLVRSRKMLSESDVK